MNICIVSWLTNEVERIIRVETSVAIQAIGEAVYEITRTNESPDLTMIEIHFFPHSKNSRVFLEKYYSRRSTWGKFTV
jgi:transketolase C-terminal domain/subunit